MKKIAIVGGGILGLSLAYELAKTASLGSDLEITIFEKADHLGGLLSSLQIENEYLENYYHHIFKSDSAIINLIEELGLGKDLQWLQSEVGFFTDLKTYNFSTALDLLRFDKLKFIDRVRTGLVSFFLQKNTNFHKFEQITALDWCNKYYGRNVTNVIWKPLLIGKFGNEFYQQVSMAWLWARIHDRSSSRQGLIAKEYLGYPKGSFQTVISKLVEKLGQYGVKIKLNYQISSYDFSNGLHYIDNAEFTDVVVTSPPQFFIDMFKPPEDYARQLQKIDYLGAVCLILELKQQFSPFYWINISDPEFPFLAIVEHTNFVDRNLFKGKSILYIAKYLQVDDKIAQMTEDDLYQLYCQYLQKVNPDFRQSWVTAKHYFKTSHAQHIVPVGYKVVSYDTGRKGLYFANFAQIYPHDRGTNYAVEQALTLTKLLLK